MPPEPLNFLRPQSREEQALAEILSGRRVSIRIETATLMFFDPDTRELLRARPNPLSYDQARNYAEPAPPAHHRDPQWSRSPCNAGPPPPGSFWSPAKNWRSATPMPTRWSPSTSPSTP